MLAIVICVGSSCFVRGSEIVAETLERLIRTRGVAAEVRLTGAFCMEHCSMGVSVRVGEHTFSGITPAEAEDFFAREVLPLVSAPAAA